jgi:hypothetical protein
MATVKGGENIQKALAEIARRFRTKGTLRVGFLAGSTYPDGTSVPMVAAIQNYGAPSRGIPPRPFFSNMVADKSPAWPDEIGAILQANGGDGEQAMRRMGEHIADQLRSAITDGTYTPTSPVTDLLKSRFPKGGQTFADVMAARRDVANGETAPASKPLIHTSNLLNSVEFEIAE